MSQSVKDKSRPVSNFIAGEFDYALPKVISAIRILRTPVPPNVMQPLDVIMSNVSKRSRRRKSTREAKRQRKFETDRLFTRRPQSTALGLLTKTDAAVIHNAVKRILWEVGAIFGDPAVAKMLVNDWGCRYGDNGHIRIPDDLVDRALSTVPDKIKLFDQNGNVRVDSSKPVTNYCPGHNCVRVLDHETGELRPVCSMTSCKRRVCARNCKTLTCRLHLVTRVI